VFTATHSRVFEQLQVVSHFTSAICMLSTLELSTLEHACTSFGEPLYAHGERPHRRAARGCVARKYVTRVAFGEGGLESSHPWDTRCRFITRAMRNPETRHRATMSHIGIKVRAHVPAPSPATRTST
jgi:hypothetical protein